MTIQSSSPEVDMERAKRAVNRFRAMLPGLNGYVRAISGNKNLSIQMASGQSRTDGKKIYLEPPIQLGDDLIHERRLCDIRDPETMKQLCSSCAVREDLLIRLYHEIAHNLYGTFKIHVTGMELKRKMYEEINKLPPKAARKFQERLMRSDYRSYLELAAAASEFMPVIVNALEDLRVDEAMFQARKGTRVMFYAMTRSTFVDGLERPDGTVSRWTDMPLNSQAIVGIFVLGTGYDYSGWFSPTVEKALSDEKLQSLVKGADKLQSSLDTFELAFPILNRLQELGFCLTPEEYEEKEQGNDGDDSEQDQDDSAEEGSSASSAGSGESADETQDQADSQESGDSSDSTGASDGDGGQGADGEVLEGTSAEQEQDASDEIQPSGSGSSEDDEVESGDEQESSRGSSSSDEGVRPEHGVPAESGNDRREAEDESEGRPEDEESDSRGREGGSGEESDQGEASDEAGQSEHELTDEEDSSNREDSEVEGDSDSGDDSPIDTGADEGLGGIPLTVLYGTAEQAEEDLNTVTKHGDHSETMSSDEKVSERTIVQALYFEKESGTVSTVVEHYYGDNCSNDAWKRADSETATAKRRRGVDVTDEVSEQVLGPALLHMRRVFADNARAKVEPNLKSGRVNARSLGRRAPFHDARLFQKKYMPGKRSYAVVIGIDISGSTVGVNIALAKLAAFAQAELCSRLGIDFAVYAHSATPIGGTHSLDMYAIKDFDGQWDTKAKNSLMAIGSWSENLDGHSLEYYRKMIERHSATDKIILYYTDGKMPAANYSEELTVLQREIETCRRKSITLLGVGIRTDSPIRHGLDTVQIDNASEVGKVVRHLESSLLHRR